MSYALEQVLSLLGKLTDAELDTLTKRLKAYRSLDKSAAGVIDDSDADLVLQIICSTMQSMGVEFTPPSQLKKTQGYAAFAEKVPALMAFVRQAAPTRNQQRVLINLGVRLLYDNLVGMGQPVSSRLVMAHVHRIPSVVNQAFPGYAQSGLLGMLVAKDA